MKTMEMNQIQKATYITSEIQNFYGTNIWFRHSIFRKFVYTEGLKFLAEAAGAYWLIDMIFGFQEKLEIRQAGYFQAWELAVNEGQTATLTCENGDGDVVFIHHLKFTDFPLPKIRMFLIHDTLLLTSEY